MADMVDSGFHTFNTWARQMPSKELCWHNRWLGPFDPGMTAEEACIKLEYYKLTEYGQESFKRGWHKAQDECKKRSKEGTA